ncbi:MAG TPA: DUF983 domain-containing protein [Pseudonocardiaceae bacterium]|nr:DUF983 domain-containing protein [Pseudonocardiaceae bacterium]
MIREVRAPDGRHWTVVREINWSRPQKIQEFEHDIAAGKVAGLMMLGLIVSMLLAIFYWTPASVVVPWWLILTFAIVVLLIPMQWALARPWTIRATTHQPVETAGEEWIGTVRGVMASRYEAARVARHIEEHAVPDDGHGPLQPHYPRY